MFTKENCFDMIIIGGEYMDFDTREIRKMEIKQKSTKSSPFIIFVIIFLTLANIGVISFIVYDKKLYKDMVSYFQKSNKEEVEEKEIQLSLTSEEVNTLYSYLQPLSKKFVMASSVTVSELNQEEIKAMGLSLLKEEDFEVVDAGQEKYRLKSKSLKDSANRILGDKVVVENQSMEMPYYQKYSKTLAGNVTLDYQDSCDCYYATFEDPEQANVEPFYKKLVKAVKKDDKIILTEKVIYTLQEEGKTQIYSNWQLSNLIEEVNDDAKEIDIDNYLSVASEIVYTFKYQDNSFRFLFSKLNEKS